MRTINGVVPHVSICHTSFFLRFLFRHAGTARATGSNKRIGCTETAKQVRIQVLRRTRTLQGSQASLRCCVCFSSRDLPLRSHSKAEFEFCDRRRGMRDSGVDCHISIIRCCSNVFFFIQAAGAARVTGPTQKAGYTYRGSKTNAQSRSCDIFNPLTTTD